MSIFRGDETEYFELIPDVSLDICWGKDIPILNFALSVSNYSEAIVLDLINRGVDLNKTDSSGRSCLECCCEYQKLNIAKILLDKGVNVNSIDKWGNNPLWRAVFKEDYKMAELLMQYGANPNNVNKAKRSPLILAKENEDEEMIAILSSKTE